VKRYKHKDDLRATAHYGRRSRGRQFPPMQLQETNNSASRLFTHHRSKSKGRHPTFFTQVLTKAMDKFLKEVWIQTRMKTQTMVERLSILFIKK